MKIVLICSAGMSTSLLVNKMQKAAAEQGIEADIAAYPEAEVTKVGGDADIILLGPQVRFELKKIRGLFPDKPVEVIDMKDYGMMNGKKVLADTIKRLNG